MLDAPVIKSLMQEDDVLGDGATDVNLFDGDVPGSAGTDAAGVWTFTADTLAERHSQLHGGRNGFVGQRHRPIV